MNILLPLIEAPASDNYRAYETLGYLEQNSMPVELEILVITRNGDGSATAPKSMKFSWPEA